MVHQYKLNGYNIVLDVFSGAVHSVDELAYDVIAMFEGSSADEIVSAMLKKYASHPEINEDEVRECIADVEELKENGRFIKISAASLKESHPHDIHITKEAPNYSVDE